MQEKCTNSQWHQRLILKLITETDEENYRDYGAFYSETLIITTTNTEN